MRNFNSLNQSAVEVTNCVRDGTHFGPELCPCGSKRKSRSCHAQPGGGWIIPTPPALLHGPPTNYMNPKCFGAASNDCSPKISREHWLSDTIQSSLVSDAGPAIVSGTPWLKGQSKAISPNALASKILCERHNNALSPLDAIAGQVFRGIRAMQESLVSGAEIGAPPPRDHFMLVNGPYLELWLLKLFMGGVAARAFGHEGAPLAAVRAKTGVAPLHEILWRGASWPDRWGMYSRDHPVDPIGTSNAVGIVPQAVNGELWGGTVEFGALQLNLALGSPDDGAIVRPAMFRFARPSLAPVNKVVALAWPEAGHAPIEYTRLD